MKKIALLLITFTFSTQAAQESSQPDEMTSFNPEYIKAANAIDTSKFCLYDDKLVHRNTVVEMAGGVLMQCKNVSAFSNEVELQWQPHDKS